jgi:hypothetical protein
MRLPMASLDLLEELPRPPRVDGECQWCGQPRPNYYEREDLPRGVTVDHACGGDDDAWYVVRVEGPAWNELPRLTWDGRPAFPQPVNRTVERS